VGVLARIHKRLLSCLLCADNGLIKRTRPHWQAGVAHR
jgi:hypothetical protein